MPHPDAITRVIWLCWICLFLTPTAMKNLEIFKPFSSPLRMKQMFLQMDIHFASEALKAILSRNAPTMELSQALPPYLEP